MSSYLDLIRLFWIGFQIAQGVLCLWIALLVFRSRSALAWITLIAATLSSLFLLAVQVYSHLAARNLSSGIDRYLEISQAMSLGYGVTLLAFLIGVLLHLQRRKLESDRIADLEAILHDLQQRPVEAPSQPPR